MRMYPRQSKGITKDGWIRLVLRDREPSGRSLSCFKDSWCLRMPRVNMLIRHVSKVVCKGKGRSGWVNGVVQSASSSDIKAWLGEHRRTSDDGTLILAADNS